MPACRILRLTLADFRSYNHAQIAPTRDLIVLTGPNGAGKTNLLEAISWLAPGRGLRHAVAPDVANTAGAGGWAVSAEVEGLLGYGTLGTGRTEDGADEAGRRCRIDREPVSSATAFAEHVRIVWLTPAMDPLFVGPASERRRFLDRIVLAVDPSHGTRVNALERVLRSRNRLLEEARPDPAWLDAIERETAEIAVAVAAGRRETVLRLRAVIASRQASAFPVADLRLDGTLENDLATAPAAEVEDRYRDRLREGRSADAAAGRTLEGPHRTDLHVFFAEKDVPAAASSTGEQKALLIGLILAQAALVSDMAGIAPILLLDEIVAHLDPDRRRALYAALAVLGAQVWMTGADPAAFADVASVCNWVEVVPGHATLQTDDGTTSVGCR